MHFYCHGCTTNVFLQTMMVALMLNGRNAAIASSPACRHRDKWNPGWGLGPEDACAWWLNNNVKGTTDADLAKLEDLCMTSFADNNCRQTCCTQLARRSECAASSRADLPQFGCPSLLKKASDIDKKAQKSEGSSVLSFQCGGVRDYCRRWDAQTRCETSCCLAHALPYQDPPGATPPTVCCTGSTKKSIFTIDKKDGPLHLVVAFCRENATDLANEVLHHHPHYEKVFVYSKCGAEAHAHTKKALLELDANLRHDSRGRTTVSVLKLRNVGGCDHTYLTHIFRHLGSNGRGAALAPVTVFTKGRPDSAALCVLRPVSTQKSISSQRRQNLEKFAVPNWKHTFNQGHHNQTFLPSAFNNFGAWLNATLGRKLAEHLLSNAQNFAYGGYFSAEAWTIERYPRELFGAILRQQVAPNEEVDHFIERLWGVLVSVPSSPELDHAIQDSVTSGIWRRTESRSKLRAPRGYGKLLPVAPPVDGQVMDNQASRSGTAHIHSSRHINRMANLKRSELSRARQIERASSMLIADRRGIAHSSEAAIHHAMRDALNAPELS